MLFREVHIMLQDKSWARKGRRGQRMGKERARKLGKVRTELVAFSILPRSLDFTGKWMERH